MSLRYPIAKAPDFGDSVEVVAGVRWMRQPLDMALNHINVYMLDDPDGAWLVDTGHCNDESKAHWRRQMDRLAGKPQALLCTHMHSDHIGLAGWLCEEYDLPLHMSIGEYMSMRAYQDSSDRGATALAFYRGAGIDEKTIEMLETRIDKRHPDIGPLPRSYCRLKSGEHLDIGGRRWRVLIGYGHSPEHVCLFNDEERLLIGGDQVLPKITSNISVMATAPSANPLQEWFESLEYFAQLPEDTLVLPSHNRPFYGLRQRLGEIRAHHEERLETLDAHLRAGEYDDGAAPAELLPALFKRRLEGIETVMAVGECIAHLHVLLDRGLVERVETDVGARYHAREN